MAQNGSELRNSLQASGLQVVRLEIGASGNGDDRAGGSGQAQSQPRGAGNGAAGTTAEQADDTGSAAALSSASVSTSSLIDVLA